MNISAAQRILLTLKNMGSGYSASRSRRYLSNIISTRTNIAERLWKLHDLGIIDREAINRYMFAYDQLTRVMMLGFVQNIKRGIVSNDYIQPYLLSKRDLKGLKEALRIAKEVQSLCARQFEYFQMIARHYLWLMPCE